MTGRHRAAGPRLPIALAVSTGALLAAALPYGPAPAPVTHYISSVIALEQPLAAQRPRPSVQPWLEAVRAATSKLGRPYVWGAKGQNDTYDCSGLTQFAWRQVGVEIGPSTYDQIRTGEAVTGPVRAGDLIFTNWGSRGPGHVALALSATEIVEAPGRGLLVRRNAMPPRFTARRITP